MKFVIAVVLLLTPIASAFVPAAAYIRKTSLLVGKDPNVFLGGNPWKPDSEMNKMGVSYDTVTISTTVRSCIILLTLKRHDLTRANVSAVY